MLASNSRISRPVAAVVGLSALGAFSILGGAASGHVRAFGFLYEAALFAGGAVLVGFGFRLLRKKRLIEDIPRSPIRSVAMGLVEVQGAARPKELLKSTLTRTDCVYFRFTVEAERRDGKGNPRWVVVNRGESTNYFYVVDGDDKLLVDPLGADTELPPDYRFVDVTGIPPEKRRYTEWYIEPGDPVFVMGTVKKFANSFGDRKQQLLDRIAKLKQDRERLLKEFDTDKDGSISVEEWDRAVAALQQEVDREELAKPLPQGDDLVLAKGDVESTMIISDHTERDLVGRYARRSFACVATGMALMLWTALSMLARAGLIASSLAIPWDRIQIG